MPREVEATGARVVSECRLLAVHGEGASRNCFKAPTSRQQTGYSCRSIPVASLRTALNWLQYFFCSPFL